MKKYIVMLALCCVATGFASAKTTSKKKANEGFVFTTVKENPITSVKNQNQSGTCWCFSTLGFLESELLRQGKGEFDLCEMFVVNKTMMDRADKAVRMHGDVSFSQGGSFYDVIYCMENYGLCPQDAMPQPGTLYGDTLPNHNEVSQLAESYVASLAKGDQQKLSPVWKNGLQSIYNSYLGECPEKFNYNGKEYTPKSFVSDVLGLKASDYVSLTSFTHHPFYSKFIIEVQDNWRWAESYNLPIDEFMEVMDNAINTGYTIAWGSDVSEDGFTRDGIAVCPDVQKVRDEAGSDAARWTGRALKKNFEELTQKPMDEITVTQEMRQAAYDNWETTDDHGMQIYGIAKDQNGKEYYMVKNSWGKTGKYDGKWYASKTFVKYKTMNILVHKDAIPAAIKSKLGIQ
jgi:aminopeptidase C